MDKMVLVCGIVVVGRGTQAQCEAFRDKLVNANAGKPAFALKRFKIITNQEYVGLCLAWTEAMSG